MDVPSEVALRLAHDSVGWLTTITDSGAPAPNPVWFVSEAGALIVFAEPSSRKVHNIRQRPSVCLHLNSDPDGGEIVIVNGDADVTTEQAASQLDAYVAKYSSQITGPLGMTLDTFDGTYSAKIRIQPSRLRLTPGS